MALHSKYFNIGGHITQTVSLNHGFTLLRGGGCFNFLEARCDGPRTVCARKRRGDEGTKQKNGTGWVGKGWTGRKWKGDRREGRESGKMRG